MNLQLQGPGGGASFGVDAAPAQWTRMRAFTGRVVDLWRLGHACRIPRRFRDDAPAARPAHLQLSFRGHARLTDVLAADVPGALRSHGASGVERLIVLLDLTADDRGLDVGPALVSDSASVPTSTAGCLRSCVVGRCGMLTD